MTKLSASLIAAAVALSLSACDRPGVKTTSDESGPPRTAQAPDTTQKAPPAYRDPSVPPNPPENQPKDPSVLPADQK